MGGLIDSLLELARIGCAELRPVQVDVSMLAEWAAAELRMRSPAGAVVRCSRGWRRWATSAC
jgi:hypothetical protein